VKLKERTHLLFDNMHYKAAHDHPWAKREEGGGGTNKKSGKPPITKAFRLEKKQTVP
jgi:hypothetical protein